MKKGRLIVGLPVIPLDQATQVGVVRDLVIDLENSRVIGYLVAESWRQPPAGSIPFESARLGPDALMIEEEFRPTVAVDLPSVCTLYYGPSALSGRRIFSEGGKLLGRVSDVMVDEKTGSVLRYEVSSSPLRDLLIGKSYLPVDSVRSRGEELMIVPETGRAAPAERAREGAPMPAPRRPEQPPVSAPPVSGVDRAAVQSISRQLDLLVGKVARRAVANAEPGGVLVFRGEPITEEIVHAAKAAGKLNQLIQAAGEQAMSSLFQGPGVQYERVVVGRMAGRTVQTTKGEILVSEGDVVTLDIVTRAREAGVLDQLVEAVGRPPQETREVEPTLPESAQSLWEQIAPAVMDTTATPTRVTGP